MSNQKPNPIIAAILEKFDGQRILFKHVAADRVDFMVSQRVLVCVRGINTGGFLGAVRCGGVEVASDPLTLDSAVTFCVDQVRHSAAEIRLGLKAPDAPVFQMLNREPVE
jgi:hypothetical protein